MTNLYRVHVEWSGWSHGPGVNVLNFSQGSIIPGEDAAVSEAVLEELVTSYQALQSYIGLQATIHIPNTVQVIDSATTEILNIITVDGGGGNVVGSNGVSSYPPGNVICLGLRSSEFVNGRLRQGRLFFGPCRTEVAGADGNVPTNVRTAFETAFSGFTSGLGPKMAIVHRASGGTAADGGYSDVTSFRCMPTLSSLRSRRT